VLGLIIVGKLASKGQALTDGQPERSIPSLSQDMRLYCYAGKSFLSLLGRGAFAANFTVKRSTGV
jgi:hypothetical protein